MHKEFEIANDQCSSILAGNEAELSGILYFCNSVPQTFFHFYTFLWSPGFRSFGDESQPRGTVACNVESDLIRHKLIPILLYG